MAKKIKNEDLQTILSDLKSQIASFDQKAAILLSVVGIVYALLLDFALVFANDWFKSSENIAIAFVYTFFFCMLFFGLLCMVCFVLSVLPRRRKKDGEKHPNYYGDISTMDVIELSELLNDYCSDGLILEKQIIVNSKICDKKHKLIFTGIICLIPFFISIIGLLISIICVVQGA